MMKLIFFLLTTVVLFSWNSALAEPCDEAWALYQKGLALSDNSFQEASYYKKAIDLCPEIIDARNRLGHVYQNIGFYELAIYHFEQAKIDAYSYPGLRTRSGSLDLLLDPYLSLGEIYRLQGRYDEAVNELTKVLEIYPDSLAAQNALQYLYKRLHKYDNVYLPHTWLLTNSVFSRIPGTIIPRGGYVFDMFYRAWTQESTIKPQWFSDDSPFAYDYEVVKAMPTSRGMDVQLLEFGLRYGLTSDLTIGLVPKYFKREITKPYGVTGEVEGWGDTVVMAKYHLWGIQRRMHLSLYGLLSIPTGDEDAKVKGQNDWRWVPLGSGSYDVAPGIAFSSVIGPLITHSNMHYLFTDGENVGDEFRFNLGLVYPIGKGAFVCLDMNYRWRDEVVRKQHMVVRMFRPDYVGPLFNRAPAGPVTVDTELTEPGGNTLYLSPSIKFEVTKGLKFEVGMQVPIYQDSEGWDEDYLFHFGLTKTVF